MLFYWAVLAYALVANVWGSRPLSVMNLASGAFVPQIVLRLLISIGVLHIAGFLAIVITTGIMSPKHDAYYVFVEVNNETGWESGGLAWMIGMLSTVYPFLG
jgi:choline transport protein